MPLLNGGCAALMALDVGGNRSRKGATLQQFSQLVCCCCCCCLFVGLF
jgi:hypothetical protein